MRRALIIACGLLFIAAGPGLAQEEDAASPALRIDWKEFRRLYDTKAIELVDVREPVPFESGHIPGARSIPLGEIEKNVAALRKVKKPIVLYCACPSEHSAALAAITLRKAGLDARALIGGYEKWRDEGGTIQTGKSTPNGPAIQRSKGKPVERVG